MSDQDIITALDDARTLVRVLFADGDIVAHLNTVREVRLAARERRDRFALRAAAARIAAWCGGPPHARRFWARVVEQSSGCWEWSGGRTKDGYGAMSVGGQFQYTHRLAYELAVGPIPDGMLIMHACDNPPCCNPAHLSVGTISDNTREAIARGLRPAQPARDDAAA